MAYRRPQRACKQSSRSDIFGKEARKLSLATSRAYSYPEVFRSLFFVLHIYHFEQRVHPTSMSFLNIVRNLSRSGHIAARRSTRTVRTTSGAKLVGGVRFMGGGGGGKSWNGFTPPHVAPIHKNMGTTMMVVMWLWLFYRAKEDGMSVLGLREPWEHGGGHSTHVDVGTVNYESPGVGEMPVAGGDGEEEH